MPERDDNEKKTLRGVPEPEHSPKPSTSSTNSDHPKSSSSSSSSSSSQPNQLPFRKKTVHYAVGLNDFKSLAKRYRTEIAACSSSILSTFLAYPLDFVKSRMQIYRASFYHTASDAYRGEGIRTFWRGVGPPLISVTVVRTISFSIYQKAKYAFDDSIQHVTGKSPLVIANAPGSFPTPSTLACFAAAGATSGAIITTLSCPFELTKLSEQIAGKIARESGQGGGGGGGGADKGSFKMRSFDTARRLLRERGISGLYSGYRLHLVRDTIGTALYFTTYESAKQVLANARGKEPASPYAVVVAGGLCGIVSWACIYPIDVAKTMYQKALLSANAANAVRPRIQFFQAGSYRGLGVSVLRSCVINMIFFSNFEMLKKRINALEVD